MLRSTVDVETVVVGAGVVGLAVARAIALAGREVLVLERAAHAGEHASSRNSGVIHAGLYYPAGSLKSALCVSGAARMYEYCRERNVPHERVGKLVVATASCEVDALRRYLALGTANGVAALRWLGPAEAQALEPEVRCVAALHSGGTGIVDAHALMTALAADLESAGGRVVFRCDVVDARCVPGGGFELRIAGDAPPLRCRTLVNSAGVDAVAFARRLAGWDRTHVPRAYLARGHYFELSGAAPFRRLVYPVADSASLGIHATLDLARRVRFGPDVEWADRVDYRFDDRCDDPRHDPRRDRFVAAIRRYYPALDPARLHAGYVGVRAKIAGPGARPADFRVDGPDRHGVPNLVHLYGIESPGLTASLALADHVRDALSRPVRARGAGRPRRRIGRFVPERGRSCR